MSPGWSPAVIGTLYLILSALWRLPNPWWLISLGSLVSLIPVVQTVESINAVAPALEGRNDSYSGANIATIAIGGLLSFLVIVATFVAA